MTSEEKRAIDEFNRLLADFKGLSKLSLWYEIDAEQQNELYNKLYPLLNLLDNQQKEIEELMKICDSYKNASDHCAENFLEVIKPNYISKGKIRETIRHYNNELEHIKNGEEFENEKPMYYWGKVALEELLEENQENGDHIPRID